MRPAREVIVRPVVSEKSYGAAAEGKYTFLVNPKSSKPEIRRAVEQIWGVHVRSVNTMHRKGKVVRRHMQFGRRSDSSRAVVTLAPGEKIEIFEGA